MEGIAKSDPGVKPQSVVDEAFSKIQTQISRLEGRLVPVLVNQSTEKKAGETSPTPILKELNKIYNRLIELNSRIRL